MHPASAFREDDRQTLTRFVDDHALASIVSVHEGQFASAVAPVILEGHVLRFHLSSRNKLTQALISSGRGLAIILAENAYVSPDWYAAADQVPTWNYRSVELEGAVSAVDRAGTERMLDDLSARFEARLAPKPPWTRQKMRPDLFAAMVGGITGFEMTVERMAGTFKLSQNKPADEIARVTAALAERPDAGSQATAGVMSARNTKPASSRVT